MDNNYNPNSQFGGWGQGAYGGYNAPYYNYYNEQYEKQKEKKNDKKLLKTMGNFFGLSIISFSVLATIFGVIIGLLSGVISKIELLYTDDNMSMAYQIIASVLFIFLPFAVAYIVLKKKKIAGILPMGTTYNKKATISLTMLCVPLMLFSTFAINFVSTIIQNIFGITFTTGVEDPAIMGVDGFLIATLSTAVLPAVLEEVIIRGIVMQPLRRFGDKFAIVASALIFGIMHGNMVQIPYTVVAGLFLGYLAVATGSLWPSIILHFINNFYSVALLAVYDNFGDTAGSVASIMFIGLFIVLGVVGGLLYFPMNYKAKLKNGVDTLKTGEKFSALFLNVPMIFAIIFLLFQTLGTIKF